MKLSQCDRKIVLSKRWLNSENVIENGKSFANYNSTTPVVWPMCSEFSQKLDLPYTFVSICFSFHVNIHVKRLLSKYSVTFVFILYVSQIYFLW